MKVALISALVGCQSQAEGEKKTWVVKATLKYIKGRLEPDQIASGSITAGTQASSSLGVILP